MQLRPKDPVPVYGSPLAIGLLEAKMRENRTDKYVDLRPIQPGQRVSFGKLSAEFIHVTHSIPDTNAIAVHSPVGTIIDTADFKFDPTPIMGKPTNERRLRKLGEAGVLALFSDTVRVESEGSTPSERVVYDTMRRVIERSKGQVIIATFASNISRLKMALDAAQQQRPQGRGRGAKHGAELARGAGARVSRSGAWVARSRWRKRCGCRLRSGCWWSPAARASRRRRWHVSPWGRIRNCGWREAMS